MSRRTVFASLLTAFISLAPACHKDDINLPDGPGADATDKRSPELGPDLGVLNQSKIQMSAAFAQVAPKQGPIIEAKFELDDSKKLSLSLYPIGMALDVDAERNKFQEYAGDPTVSPYTGKLEAFTDAEHLTRSARDLTLIQLSRVSLTDAVNQASSDGIVFWAIPTIRKARAGYGVYTYDGDDQHYRFIDGGGSMDKSTPSATDPAMDPGSKATDKRVPELGADLSILATAKVTMLDGIALAEQKYGPVIEAKFELDGSNKLSLSLYPIGQGLDVDAERNKFQELAGDPTVTPFNGSLEVFTDTEHLTRSSRDLTIVQTAGMTLKDAVKAAQTALPDGFVYWAIPTIRDTRAGYGVYVYGKDKKPHYFFIAG